MIAEGDGTATVAYEKADGESDERERHWFVRNKMEDVDKYDTNKRD